MMRILSVLFLSALTMAQAKQPKELKPLPNLAETIEWLTGASEEEAGWGSGSFQFHSVGRCEAEISTVEVLEHTDSDKNIRRGKYSFRLAEIDPSDVRVESGKLWGTPYEAIEFHTRNYTESISFTLYKNAVADWSEKEVEYTKMVRTPFTSDLKTNDSFAPRFVKAFRRAVELCGGKKTAY